MGHLKYINYLPLNKYKINFGYALVRRLLPSALEIFNFSIASHRIKKNPIPHCGSELKYFSQIVNLGFSWISFGVGIFSES